MPTTEIVNTQQTLQMGTHAEKLQQTMQQLTSTSAQQIQEEQVAEAKPTAAECFQPKSDSYTNQFLMSKTKAIPRKLYFYLA